MKPTTTQAQRDAMLDAADALVVPDHIEPIGGPNSRTGYRAAVDVIAGLLEAMWQPHYRPYSDYMTHVGCVMCGGHQPKHNDGCAAIRALMFLETGDLTSQEGET